MFEYLKRRPILAASIPIVAVLAIQAATKMPSEWISVFVAGSRSYVGGRDIYAEPFGYLYPPFMALLFTPFVPLPQLAARLIYVAISIACIVGLARSAWIVSGGQTLPPISRPIAAEWKIALTGALCAAPYILNALAHMQVDVMIDCLVAVGCLLLIRGQGVAGAVLIENRRRIQRAAVVICGLSDFPPPMAFSRRIAGGGDRIKFAAGFVRHGA